MKKILALLITISLLAGCSFQTKHRGYVFPSDLDAQVVGVKTTAQLTKKFGNPLAKTIHGDLVWIYYGADENYHGPFPHSYDNKTVLLAWINGASVSKIRVLRDADLPDVRPADGETPIPAAIELNAFEELINNVGRFKPAGLGS
jgi:outer membrane protein assembly factor BamE (lipoprotein component of BamABCDE complex)